MLNRISSVNQISRAEEEHGFDLREGIGFLWRQWLFISTIVGTILFVSAAYVYTETPRYTATAELLLEPQQQEVIGGQNMMVQDTPDLAKMESQLEIIRSTIFLRRVVER